MRGRWWWAGALVVLAGCGESGGEPRADAGADGGPVDAGTVDAGRPDAGRPDAGRPDAGGPIDAGFADPSILLEGLQEIGGQRMFVRLRGTTTSTHPPVIVLASGPGLSADYLVEPLDFLLGPGGREAPDRRLAVVDPTWTGASRLPTAGTGTVSSARQTLYDVDAAIDFVRSFAGRDGPVDIVGHGYGAGLAALHAARDPADVARLVLLNPYPPTVREQAEFMAAWNARLSASDRERLELITRYNICLRDLDRCSREAWAVIGPTWLCPANRPRFDDLTFERIRMQAIWEHIVPNLRDARYDWTGALEQVTAPATVISGPCDPIPAASAATYAARIAGATHHVLPDTGHFPMVEDRPAFERIVARALGVRRR